MSTTVPPRPLLADEAALRRVFDAEFETLLREATQELGEAGALAPRAVESAFVCAWKERESITTESHLRIFLHDEVHHAVARLLSRRAAAHRLGHHKEGAAASATRGAPAAPAATADESWSHVVHAIHGGEHDAESIARAAQHSRHEAAEHVASIGRPRDWKVPVAIGVIAIAATVGAILWVDRVSAESAAERAVNAQDVRVSASVPGRMALVTLGEGTRVRLAPDSKLSVPQRFGEKLRAVKLEGAATFEPAKGLEEPLKVFARDAILTATGTVFSVRSWEPAVIVQVREGSVAVRAGSSDRTVNAGETVIVEGGNARAATAAERAHMMAWTADSLIVDDLSLREALPELRRWYGVDVKVPDASLLDRKVSIHAPLASARAAVEEVERTANVIYGYEGRDLAFKDAAKKGTANAARPKR